MQIRLSLQSDVDSIAALHAANWRQTYRGILSDDYLDGDLFAERKRVWSDRFANPVDHQQVFIAAEGRSLVGFACAYGAFDPDQGTLLENLHVAGASRGTGVGIALIRQVARWSMEQGLGAGMHLWALDGNRAARAMYERWGGAVNGSGQWSPPLGPPVGEVRYFWPDASSLLP